MKNGACIIVRIAIVRVHWSSKHALRSTAVIWKRRARLLKKLCEISTLWRAVVLYTSEMLPAAKVV